MTRREQELWAIAEATLTPKQLTVCRLVWIRHLSIRKTAIVLEISPSTVTSHLRTARRNIAATIAQRKDAA
jgi:DNA-directed RNA polymerase specialized sigma24 family protein